MARRISLSQFQSRLRDLQRRQHQAVDRYNQDVRRHNQNVRRAVDNYNRQVRTHNARVRANRQRLQSALNRLAQQPVTTRHVVFRSSVQSVSSAYVRLEERAPNLDPRFNDLLDLSEREAANTVDVMNTLLGSEPSPEEQANDVESEQLTNELTKISPDLRDRWRGAVFALNPNNPDAARHFCTSAREIITHILESRAPDGEVFAALPGCAKTEQGRPTRKARIHYFLRQKGMVEDTLEEFVEQDLQNIVHLFDTFNSATHGAAGKFHLSQLAVIRKRVEDGIFFLSRLIEQN